MVSIAKFFKPKYASIALLSLLAACEQGGDLKPLQAYNAAAYRLGSGDQVRLITFGEDQLTGQFSVNDQGNLALPLLGTVHAAGLTTTQLSDAVSEQLSARGLMKTPSVSVEVETYRPVFVLGEVSKPGQYAYQPGMTVLTAVAIAGGYTYRAVEDHASVTRAEAENGKATEGYAVPQDYVKPGDVIKVYERHF